MSRGVTHRPGLAGGDRLAASRERVLTAEPVEPNQVRDAILASWWRSRRWNVAADRIDLSYIRDPDLDTPLTRSAMPILRHLRENLEGQAISVILTDANGVAVTSTYDDLGRLRTRSYPDGGVEKFGYSPRGLIAYTNQLGYTNFYAYDEAGRKTFETNANAEVIRYTNSPAGDLLSLTDGKNQTTKWNYDTYGRVTNKVDQAGTVVLKYIYDPDNRLTNRWSVAKGTTTYKYDAVGNLPNVVYPAGTPSVTPTRWSKPFSIPTTGAPFIGY